MSVHVENAVTIPFTAVTKVPSAIGQVNTTSFIFVLRAFIKYLNL